MGRKNKRMNKAQDKNFEKFMKTFMEEQQQDKKKFRSSNMQKTPANNNYQKDIKRNELENIDNNIDYSERNKERLAYAKQQLDSANINYKVVDENSTLIYCNRKSDNYVIKYYASNGFIVGFPDFRGIRSLLMLLTKET